jgi:hypothetical protein
MFLRQLEYFLARSLFLHFILRNVMALCKTGIYVHEMTISFKQSFLTARSHLTCVHDAQVLKHLDDLFLVWCAARRAREFCAVYTYRQHRNLLAV